MSFRKKLLFSMFVFVLFFALLELGLGLFYFKGRIISNQTDRLFALEVNMDQIGHGIHFRTNSLAMAN